MKTKNFTTKQSIKRLEQVTTKLFVNVKMLEAEVGKLQKTLAGYNIVSDEEE